MANKKGKIGLLLVDRELIRKALRESQGITWADKVNIVFNEFSYGEHRIKNTNGKPLQKRQVTYQANFVRNNQQQEADDAMEENRENIEQLAGEMSSKKSSVKGTLQGTINMLKKKASYAHAYAEFSLKTVAMLEQLQDFDNVALGSGDTFQQLADIHKLMEVVNES